MTDEATPREVGALSEGLGPLVEVLAAWEDKNGTMAAILPSEWDALKQDVMDACVIQSPRMLRNELLRLRARVAELEATEEGAKTAFGHVVEQKQAAERECMRVRGLLAAAYADIRRAAQRA